MDCKCAIFATNMKFFKPSAEYLVCVIYVTGLKELLVKEKAILQDPPAGYVSLLHSFLGLLNYYGTFLHNLATVLVVLHKQLHAQKKWKWTRECEYSFKEEKKC